MSDESEQRGRCRLTLTIKVVHSSVRPIVSEDGQMPRVFLFRWPLSIVGGLCAPHHGGKSANPSWLYSWAKPLAVVVSQRPSVSGTADALSPLERGGTPLLRTWERGAIHFRWSSDRILTQGFLDRDDRPHVPLTGLGAN